MFSRKGKTPSAPGARSDVGPAGSPAPQPRLAPDAKPATAQQGARPAQTGTPVSQHKAKPRASVLSTDIYLEGNLRTTGGIQIEGTIKGDVRAHMITVGETAKITGVVVADDVVVNGKVEGMIRGVKVRLTSSAHVVGDIIHKTIAIESGARFDGKVSRREKPLDDNVEQPSTRNVQARRPEPAQPQSPQPAPAVAAGRPE